MRRSLALAVLVVMMAVLTGVITPARSTTAQGAITVVSEQPQNDYPRGVAFNITVRAPGDVKEARLLYQVAPDGVGAEAVADCTGTGTVSCSYELVSGRGIYIIPGAEITYHWEITGADGAQLSTESKVYVHQDTRFTFATLKQDNVTVYYHAGAQSQAQAVLDAAADTLTKVGQLEGTQVTFPVKVFVYTTAQEMQPSIAPGGSAPGVVILGEVVYSDTAMVSEDVETLDIVRHEVAHIVTAQATKGPYGIASWLNEGISVYSQTKVLSSHASALAAAIRNNTVLSMNQLNSSSTGSASDTVSLFYGEAGSIVKFLVETYGPEKFAALLKTFKDGSTADNAFESVYGFDQLGLENNWRQSVGLPPRAASATATPRATEQARGAITPVGGSGGSATATSSGGGTNVTMIAIIAGMMVLVAIAAGTAIFAVRRRV
jgi:Peptidase MA superfamily